MLSPLEFQATRVVLTIRKDGGISALLNLTAQTILFI